MTRDLLHHVNPSGIWGWILDPKKRARLSWISSFIAALVIAAWTLYTHFSDNGEQVPTNTNSGNQIIGHNNTAKASEQSIAANAGRDANIGSKVDVNAIVNKLVEKSESGARLKAENRSLRKQLAESVEALKKQRGRKDVLPGINEALALLKQGKTKAAEGIFQAIAHRKEAHIAGNKKAAAAAYRHLGALAYLNDPQKALDAYRRAAHLDPDNAGGWNRLGQLFYRTGEPSKAETAF